MVAPAVVAAGIGALGSIAGGLLSRKKSKIGPRTMIELSAKGARDQGLHPLAVLGGGIPSFSQVDGGSILGDIARGAGDLGAAYFENKQAEKDAAAAAPDKALDRELARKQIELVNAEIAESRSRTILNAGNAKRLLDGPRPLGTTGTHGGLETLDGRKIVKDPARNLPSRQRVQLGNYEGTGLNPEAFEVGLGEAIVGLLTYGPQWLWEWGKEMSPKERQRFVDERTVSP